MTEIEAFYTCAYDVPSEFRKNLQIITEKEASALNIQPDNDETKKKKIEEKTWLNQMRNNYKRELFRLGRVVNNSVWIIPQKNYERLKELNEKYERLWKERGYEPNLKIIKFSSDETTTLKNLAKEKILDELNKFLEELTSLGKIVQEQKKIHGKTAKRIIRTTKEIEGITEAFNIKDEMQDMLKLIRLSVEEIQNNAGEWKE